MVVHRGETDKLEVGCGGDAPRSQLLQWERLGGQHLPVEHPHEEVRQLYDPSLVGAVYCYWEQALDQSRDRHVGLSVRHEVEGGGLGREHLPATSRRLGEHWIFVGDERWLLLALPLGGRTILCGEANIN